MNSSRQLQVHSITSVSHWPATVKPITNRLLDRLPQWVEYGPHPQTASFSAYLVSELQALAGDISPTNGVEPPSPPLLRDVFDLVMSSCADLRTIAGRALIEPKLTKAVTFGLIASLFKSFFKDLVPRKYAGFVHGGTLEFSLVQTLSNEDLVIFEEKYQAFVESEMRFDTGDGLDIDDQANGPRRCVAIDQHEYLSLEATQDYRVRRRGSSWFDDPDLPDETLRSQISSQPTFASLEIPEHAHILESHLPRDHVDVPVVCVANAEAMPSAMSNLLQQRQTWGLDEPVLCIITSNDGLIVRLAIGWLEKSGTEISAHVVTSSGDSFEQGLGVYNLLNPLSCMSFARLILGLEHDVQALSARIMTRARGFLPGLCAWSPDASRISVRANEYIEQWRLQVQKALAISIDPVSDTSASLLKDVMTGRRSNRPKASTDHEQGSSSKAAPRSTAYSTLESSARNTVPGRHVSEDSEGPSNVDTLPSLRRSTRLNLPSKISDPLNSRSSNEPIPMSMASTLPQSSLPMIIHNLNQDDAEESTNSGGVGSDLLGGTSDIMSRWSNSQRCDLSDLTYDRAGTVLESLIDRNILIVPHISTVGWRLVPRELDFIIQSMQEMLEIYEEDTRPRWVEGWDKEDDIPSFGTRLSGYRKELFRERRLYGPTYFLEHAAAKALIDRLPSLVESCDLARIRNHLAYLRGANEAERRQSWDQYLLKASLAADSTAIHSINLICERGVNFPDSPWTDKFLSDEPTLTWKDLNDYHNILNTIYSLYSLMETNIRDEEPSDAKVARLCQLEAATDHMGFLRARVEGLRATRDRAFSAASFERIMRQRCAAESLTGICDTLLVVPCADAGRQIHETLFHTLREKMPSTTIAGLKAIFDQSVEILEDFQFVLSPSPERSVPTTPGMTARGSKEPLQFGVAPESSAPATLKSNQRDVKVESLHPSQGPDRPLQNWPRMTPGTGGVKNFQSRTKTALNSFFTDCSTANGVPKPAIVYTPDPTETTMPMNIDLLDMEESITDFKTIFESFLAKYNASPGALHFDLDLILPLFLVEYKRASDDTIRKATNQGRSYLAAALEFLKRLGIRKQPVYVFVTNGNRGALSMGMYNEPDPGMKVPSQALIMEWNVRVYDIANVRDVFELSVFMQRLAERGKELQARFMKNHLPAFLEDIRKDPDVLKWSVCSRVSKKERIKYKDRLAKDLKERQIRYPEPKKTSRGAKGKAKGIDKEDKIQEDVEGVFEV